MSCCGGNCGCGAGCKCGSGCGGCKRNPDLSFSGESTTTIRTLIAGVAPLKGHFEEAEMGFEAAGNCGPNCKCGGGDCKCGDNCSC